MQLAIDTSTDSASLALVRDGDVVAELTWRCGQNHTRQLLPNLEHLLRQFDLSPQALTGIIVARGPGSFNGLRVGIIQPGSSDCRHQYPGSGSLSARRDRTSRLSGIQRRQGGGSHRHVPAQERQVAPACPGAHHHYRGALFRYHLKDSALWRVRDSHCGAVAAAPGEQGPHPLDNNRSAAGCFPR